MSEVTLEKVGPENLPACGIGCLTGPKNLGYQPKVEWLQTRFAEGLRFLLYRDEKGNYLGHCLKDRTNRLPAGAFEVSYAVFAEAYGDVLMRKARPLRT